MAIVGTLIQYPDGMPQKDIARAVFRTKQATTIALDSLEKKGYIKRGTDAKDRRTKTITLTAEGRALYLAAVAPLRGVCYEALSCLSETEVDRLYVLLVKLGKALRERIEHEPDSD